MSQRASDTPRPARRSRGRVVTLVLIAFSLLVAGLFGSAVIGLFWVLDRDSAPVEVADGSYLFIDLRKPVTDAPVQGGLFAEPNEHPLIVTEIAASIRLASVDDRIAGVYLRQGGPSLGWGLSREIREALVAFREAGKPCATYSEVYDMRGYYLASACDHVLVAPAGVGFVAGLSSTTTYYRDGLEQHLGLQAQFVHVGEYKTAIEPYTRMEPSEAAIEANEYLFDSLYDTVVGEIATSRGVDLNTMMSSIDALKMVPSDGVIAGLFDGVAYPDAIYHYLDTMGSDGWVASLSELPPTTTDEERDALAERIVMAKEYRSRIWSNEEGHEDHIAIIYAEGVILSGDGGGGLFGSSGLFDRPYRDWMRSARNDDSVKAIVVRVNSPGGSALASDFMWREVELTRAAGKPVVISMGNYAASGGYMMSTNADWIVAQPTTITGSIGIFGQFFNIAGLYQKLGMAEHTYKRGEHADLLNTNGAFSESERAVLETWIRHGYNKFVGQVAEGRGRTVAQIEPSAQGRVWTGVQAIAPERALVDELGGLHNAIDKAAELASLDGGAYAVSRWPKQKTFWQQVIEEFDKVSVDTIEIDVKIPGINEALLREAAVLEAIQQDGGLSAYVPGVDYR